MSAYATNTNAPAMRGNWFTRAIDWMDGNGPGAWIALMVASQCNGHQCTFCISVF